MNKIVEIFVNREDENYSLYKYLQRVGGWTPHVVCVCVCVCVRDC